MLDAAPSEVIIQPAPETYLQAQQSFVRIAGRAFNSSTEKLTYLFSGKQPISNDELANGQYLYGAIRQAALGFGRLIQMSNVKAGSPVMFSYTPGDALKLRVSGEPTASVCDATRRLFVGGLWEDAGTLSKNRTTTVISNFNEAGIRNFNQFSPRNAEYAVRKMFAIYSRIRQPNGDITPTIGRMELQLAPSILTCLRGRMMVVNNNTYMPLFSEGPQPGVFKP